MSNSYVTVYHDSFKNKTTTKSYTLNYKLNPRRSTMTETADINLRHVSSEPDLDALLIDVHFKSVDANPHVKLDDLESVIRNAPRTYPGEWALLRNGQLIIQINNTENIGLDAIDSGSDVTTQDITRASACEEQVFYRIDKTILDKICTARTVRMQLSGSKASWELDGSDFIFMAKTFWNGFYDEKMYAEEITHVESVSQKQDQIKKKGCLLEILSVVIGFILVSLTESADNDFLYIVIPLIFIIIIPVIIAVIKRKRITKVQ